jgi:formamidopyrimidine-DNA glycosylase
MPELPDIEAYLIALRPRIVGERLEAVRLQQPFLLRSVDPPLATAAGRSVAGVERLGKRIVFGLESDLFLVLHLMIAGRLHWRSTGAAGPRRRGLAAFDFSRGTLILTEAGSKRRASLHLVRGREALASMDPGGIDPLTSGLEDFRRALLRENHTVKRALTDPTILSGIGNSYSDEILHRGGMSPFKQTAGLTDEEWGRLHGAVQTVLGEWLRRLSEEAERGFPEKVTAFRPGMSVHGRYGRPCPVCGTAIQRIRYAENESNYCPRCQTGGRLLADRALSRLLKADWPRTADELERRSPGPSEASET